MNMKKVIAAVCLLALLITTGVPAAFAEEDAPNTIHIASVDDLRQLAVDCALDTYSEGLTVILDTDLDLSGVEFYAIPLFNGTFEGCDHSITGLYPAGASSYQGLFRYIRDTGVVRDLHVYGSVAPDGRYDNIGGLAGYSSGTLENCSFEGRVAGNNYVGGLVGKNAGIIMGCSFSGHVDGKRFTGGIAGYSEGVIRGCINTGTINTTVSEAVLSLEDITSASTMPLELLSAEDENVVSDSGGIAGYSSGILLNCVNRGNVGYQHYGYNVGGIAGRQSGYLSGCLNYAEILGRKDVAGIVGQMEPYLEIVESVNLADEILLLNDYLNAVSQDLADMSAELQEAQDEMDSSSLISDSGLGVKGSISRADEEAVTGSTSGTISSGSASSSSGGISRTGGEISNEDMDSARDQIKDQTDLEIPEEIGADEVNAVSDDLYSDVDGMNRIIGILSSSSGYAAEDLTNANDQFSRVLMLMSNALGGASNYEVFDDVSDELGEADLEGRVSLNENYGDVDADNNVGGIIGSMGIEYEFDLEDTLVETIGANGIVSTTYDAKCVSSENVNYGSVTAKKDRAGGIAGSSELGAVTLCQSYGAVESSDGGYVGGVVGYSSTVIRGCYAMCSLQGSSYVGGIVGYGNEITDCVSLIQTDASHACTGAIAGWADMTAPGAVDRNLYVHESLGAVDGISYTGLAMPVSYEELLLMENLPDAFRSLRLTFLADGHVVKELIVDYGGSVAAEDIPAVPEKAGYTGMWENFETDELYFSATIEAIYVEHQTALASQLTRDDSPMSVVLLEGDFGDDVTIALAPYGKAGASIHNGDTLETWSLQVGTSDGRDIGSYTVRYLTPELSRGSHRLAIYVLNDGVWTEVSTGTNGSYTTFSAEGDSLVFSAVEMRGIEPKTIVLIAAAMIAVSSVAIILTISIKRKKLGKN